MKLFVVVFFLSSVASFGQVVIPVTPTDIVSTATISAVQIDFGPGQDWVTVVRSYLGEDGRYGKMMDESDIRIKPILSKGDEVSVVDLIRYLSNMRVTATELDAAGDALGITWVTANGNDELAVMLYAFVTKLANELGQDQAWISSVVQSIQAEIFGQ